MLGNSSIRRCEHGCPAAGIRGPLGTSPTSTLVNALSFLQEHLQALGSVVPHWDMMDPSSPHALGGWKLFWGL